MQPHKHVDSSVGITLTTRAHSLHLNSHLGSYTTHRPQALRCNSTLRANQNSCFKPHLFSQVHKEYALEHDRLTNCEHLPAGSTLLLAPASPLLALTTQRRPSSSVVSYYWSNLVLQLFSAYHFYQQLAIYLRVLLYRHALFRKLFKMVQCGQININYTLKFHAQFRGYLKNVISVYQY